MSIVRPWSFLEIITGRRRAIRNQAFNDALCALRWKEANIITFAALPLSAPDELVEAHRNSTIDAYVRYQVALDTLTFVWPHMGRVLTNAHPAEFIGPEKTTL